MLAGGEALVIVLEGDRATRLASGYSNPKGSGIAAIT